jgi:hypothetical protein
MLSGRTPCRERAVAMVAVASLTAVLDAAIHDA